MVQSTDRHTLETSPMTYRFQSRAAGDVLMSGPAGDSVLTDMGVPPAAKGIITPEAMPAAIQAIEAAITQDEALRPVKGGAMERAQAGEEDGEPVSLRQRAWPLVDMMRRAQAAGESIVWGV